jgi:hypothetical protein
MNIDTVVDEVMNLAGMKNDFVYYSMNPFDLQQYVLDHTLPEFSRILPNVEDVQIHLRDKDILERSERSSMSGTRIVYALPEELRLRSENGEKIFSVGNLEVLSGSASNTGMPAGLGQFNFAAMDITTLSIPRAGYQLTAASFGMPRYQVKYADPHKIIISNGNGYINEGTVYKLRVSFQHARNLKTMGEKYYSTFRQLAYYDIVSYLLDNELKFMDQLNTGNSSTDLKLQLYEDIQNARKTFLEDLRSKRVYDSAVSFITSV